jgi:uncharacterized protein YhaN
LRFLRLDLLRYGPFTDRMLVFRPGARLHLVYGPNEAGKSSALAAIGDLLFGFPHGKAFDFVHEASTLRIGASLRAGGGQGLEFRRRRGNKNTLLAANSEETPLFEDALVPFVGSLSRDVFSRAFGLNSASLRAGGDAMLASEGEMGAALFAAASGLTGLMDVRRRLEGQADAIYAPRASKDRRFYQALDRYKGALDEERRGELKAGTWRELVGEIEEIEQRLGEIRSSRAEVATALARLQRLRRVEPIIAALSSAEGELAEFADLPEVAEGFVERGLAAIDADEAAAVEERVAANEFAEAKAALEAIEVDEALVARSAEVLELFSRSGDYASKLNDMPRIEIERDEFADILATHAQRLGFANAESMLRGQPSDGLVQMLRELIEEGDGIERQIADLERRHADELAAAAEEDEAAFGIADPKPFRDRLAALGPDLKRLEGRIHLEAELRRLSDKLRDGRLRLSPRVTDLDLLSEVGLPSRDMLAAHKQVLDGVVAEIAAETLRLEANEQARGEVEADLAVLEGGGPLAYAETIRLVRADRDASFAALRDHLLGQSEPPMEPAEAEALLVQFEEEIAEADRLVDLALNDAERLSRVAAQRERLHGLAAEQPVLIERISRLRETQDEAGRNYAELFAPAGIAPLAPDLMMGWLGSVEELMATRREIEALEAEIAGLDRLAEELRGALLALSENLGLAGNEAMPVLALSRLVEGRIAEIGDDWQAQASREGARKAAAKRIGRLEAELLRIRPEHADWRARFETVLPELGLPPDLTTGAAAAALDIWVAVPQVNKERSNRAARVDGMRRDTESYEAAVFELRDMLAPGLEHLPPEGVVAILRERAEAAATARARQQDARSRLDAAKRKLDGAASSRDVARTMLAQIAEALPADADMRAALLRLQRRSAVHAELQRKRREFEAAAEGVGEAETREQLTGFDHAQAPLEIQDLERRAAELGAENDRLHAGLGQKQAEREQLESGTGAERAAFARLGAEADIVASARDWVVRKIAASMLTTVMERHREGQSDPLLDRAGALFATLTGGSFDRLLQDYGEDDRPVLVFRRRTGELVRLEALSEGTRDQLYLALRLAYLEDYASSSEAVPFIGDDIFQTFDDDRTAAGIRALGETAELFQPILFTHHRNVAEIARATLGDDLDYIEL